MRRAWFAVAILLAAGCGSPTEPGDSTPGARMVTVDGVTITIDASVYENHQPSIDYSRLLIAGGRLRSDAATFPPAIVVRSITVIPEGGGDTWASSSVETSPGWPDPSYKSISISGPHRWAIGSKVTVRVTVAGASGATAVLEQNGVVIGDVI